MTLLVASQSLQIKCGRSKVIRGRSARTAETVVEEEHGKVKIIIVIILTSNFSVSGGRLGGCVLGAEEASLSDAACL